MTVREKIKKARYVFGWVMLTQDEGKYLQIQKQSILQALREGEFDEDIFVIRDGGDLYINQFVNVTKCRGGENRQEFSVPAPATNCRTPAGAKFRGSRFTENKT